MPPPARADQVYQLTLTELAFIVIFLILLLSGWMIVKTDDEKAAALREKEQALSRLSALPKSPEELERMLDLRQALAQAQQELRQALADRGMTDPDAIVSALTRNAEAEGENRRLRQRIEDLDAQLTALREITNAGNDAAGENRRLTEQVKELDAQLTALREIRKLVEETAGAVGGESADAKAAGDSARRALLGAVAFRQILEQETHDTVAPGREREKALEYADAWRAARAAPQGSDGLERLTKENRDLRAQAAWMRNQLGARGGRDYPPCWAEEATGKTQYLFTVVLHDGGIAVEPAWPPERNGDAEKLPGLEAVAGAGILSIPAFRTRLQSLDADSKARHCRHYVRLINRVGNLATFNRQRYAVEEFFYKFEVR